MHLWQDFLKGVRIGESKLTEVNLIKRMVMKRCIYDVDLNEMAVEFAKLSLWLDSFTPGAPLSFVESLASNSDLCQNKKHGKADERKKPSTESGKMAGKTRGYKISEEGISGEGSGLGGKVHGVREGTGKQGAVGATPLSGKREKR